MATTSTFLSSCADVIWRTERVGRARVMIISSDIKTPDLGPLAAQLGSEQTVTVRQVHGSNVVDLDQVHESTEADALLLTRPHVAAVVRVADCTPLAIVDREQSLAAVVHAGRAGLVAGVVPAAVGRLRAAGAERLTAVVGPRICGACYELPAELADAVTARVPAAHAVTREGNPAADIGAGVVHQLHDAEVEVTDVGATECTFENSRWQSYRRQGDAAGRFGIAVVLDS